jgi:hypothetical protein
MANTAATLSLNIPAITALCTGPRGSQILAASGLPTNTRGLSGDYYIDTSTGLYYGPKTTVWSTTPLFSLNNSLSSFAYTLVSGTTSLIIPQYGNNKIFSTNNNSAILGGQNNALTGDNSFILGSNITAAITGFTLINNLSTTGTLYTSSGDSNLWYSAYTAVSPNSANWNSVYTSFNGVSAQDNAVFTAVSPNSAKWNSTYTTVTANSGNWQSAYGVTSTYAYLTYSLNSGLSSIVPQKGTFTITGTASNIGGGNFNNVLSSYSSVLGGIYNTASGNYSNITGGYSGRAIGNYSNIAGGICNTASGYSSSIGGGFGNTASGNNAAIVAGCGNAANNCSAFIGGGRFNTASGNKAAIVGGLSNTASGDYSFVAGGSANDTKGFANTFILGTSLSAVSPNYTYVNNLSSQGNTVVSGTLGVAGISTLNSLNVTNSTTVIGSISSRSTIYGTSLNIGNPNNSVTGNNSAVLGGQNNIASGNCTTVSGQYNCATASSSIVLGGCYNCAIAPNPGGAVIGGYANTNSGQNSTIANGCRNCLKANNSFIGSGLRNTIDGVSNAIVGGECNNIIIGSSCSFIAGGLCNNIPTGVNNAFILGSSLSASQSNFTYVNNLSSQVNAYTGNNIYTGGRTVSDPTIDMSGGLQVNGTGSTQLTISKNLSSSFAINVSETSPGTVGMFDYGRGYWIRTLFLSGGNVGIGTSSQLDGKLTIKAGQTSTTSPVSLLKLQNLYTGIGGYRNYVGIDAYTGDSGTTNTKVGTLGFATSESQEGTFSFINYPSGNPTERLRIDSSGNVGIGTSSPNTALTVTGAISASSGYYFGDGSSQASAAIGTNQSWQNVTASRARSVTYTNSTTRPIQVVIYGTQAAAQTVTFYINGTAVSNAVNVANIGSSWLIASHIIPVGSTYLLGAGNQGINWWELR